MVIYFVEKFNKCYYIALKKDHQEMIEKIADAVVAKIQDSISGTSYQNSQIKVLRNEVKTLASAKQELEKLKEKYKIVHHQGYNFFPRTPHIEHLVVLDKNIQDKVTEVL